MYICLCHGITESQLESCVDAGAHSLCDLRGQLGVATQCGCCETQVLEILEERLARKEGCVRRADSVAHQICQCIDCA